MGKVLDVRALRKAVARGGSDILKWTEDGQVTGYVDPRTQFQARHTHWGRIYKEVEEEKTKKKVMKVVGQSINCPNDGDKKADLCRVCRFRKLLRDSDLPLDEVVLIVGEGKERVDITKGDVLGEEGFDWKLDMRYKKEFLCGFVPVEKDGLPKENKVSTLIMPKTLGQGVLTVIDDRMDEHGEEAGNLLLNPYALKLKYDDKAEAQAKYKAFYNETPYTDEMKALFEDEGSAVDLDSLTGASEAKDVDALLAPYLQVNLEGLGLEVGGEVTDEAPAPPPKTAAALVKPAPKAAATAAKPATGAPAPKTVTKPAPKAAAAKPAPDPEPFGEEPAGEEAPEEESESAEDVPAPEEEEAPTPPAPAPAPKPAAAPGARSTAAPVKAAAAPAAAAPVRKVKTVTPPKPVEPAEVAAARAAGEVLDECPACHKDVHQAATACPWPECGAAYAAAE